jgi:hypothetical protein
MNTLKFLIDFALFLMAFVIVISAVVLVLTAPDTSNPCSQFSHGGACESGRI